MLTGPKYHCSNVITGLLRDRRRGGGREEKGKKRSKGCCTVYDMASWNVCSSLDPPSPPHRSTSFHMDLKNRRGRDRSVFHSTRRRLSSDVKASGRRVFIRPHVHSRPSSSTRRPRQKRLTWFWLKPRRAARHGAVTFETQSSAAAIQISGDVLKTFNSPQCSPCRDSYTYVHNFFKISDGWSRAT